MKYYTITVNGIAYDVTVEEKERIETEEETIVESNPSDEEKQSGHDSMKIKAGTAGKIVQTVVTEGQKVVRGDSIVLLKAMEMEIPVVTPSDGIVLSIDVSIGQTVKTGDVLATLQSLQ